jgi:bifunctional enzyme CysN/CysC
MVIDDLKHGVIWIKGYSASGKTTVARKVEHLLRKQGCNVISLDGDDLRSIFGNEWGYDKESRHELARVYFRLCSHLSSQGYIVVISAVAMFDFLEKWVIGNIDNSLQVFLNVPVEERKSRDADTKKNYINKEVNDHDYDVPKLSDLIVDNFGDISPANSAEQIVSKFNELENGVADRSRTSHWKNYYSKDIAPVHPSSFAEHVINQLDSGRDILEIGCGNGRDAAYFSSNEHYVDAIDRSEAAIELCKQKYSNTNLNYNAGEISQLDEICNKKYDVVYSRFVIHAMPVQEELILLQKVFQILNEGGLIFIECRSINDPLSRKGEVISPTERIHGHYRRFIIPEELHDRLTNNGYEIISMSETSGLSVHDEDDPVLIRVKASKKVN